MMATRRSARSRQQLERRALEFAAQQLDTKDLELVGVDEDVVPSTSERLTRFSVRRRGEPNAPATRIVIDAYGEAADVAAIERAEGVRLFAPTETPIDLTTVRRALTTIEPPTFEARLGCCRGASETVKVHIPASGAVAKADV